MSVDLFRWNQLDIAIVALSIMGIALEELKMNAALPINPTIIRIMRVLRIARGGAHVHSFEFGCDVPSCVSNNCSLSLPPPLSLSAVLKLLKMATGMRALLDTVMQALPQVNTDSSCRGDCDAHVAVHPRHF